jgi:Fur family transcriptional regulator, ferric uptake regulator
MSSAQETFKQLIKEAGYSVTAARSAVFGALLDQEPLRMQELAQRVPDVDRSSVYRAVELFEQLGIVQRLNTGWKYKIELTDKFAAHHHHLTCTVCGKTVAMKEGELETFIETLAHSHGFVPQAHQIEIQGLCAQCAAKESAAATRGSR